MADILHAAGREIVEQDDLFAFFKQSVRQMRADKTRATRDEISQSSS
jgi:hypothetical protein